jgi:hypothetical protein
LDPGALILTDGERRLVGVWAADCAERALPLFGAKAPSDTRPRAAVEGIRAFGRGGLRKGECRALALAALRAARDVGDPAAAAAARAAGYAAASPFMHPLATLDQAKHLLAPAVYAALAQELAAGGDPQVGVAGIRWAVEHAGLGVREVARRMPARERGRTRLSVLYHLLDAGLRG